MSSSKHSVVKAPRSKRPQRLRQFAGATLIMAWMVFWLNTALSPCCDAFATTLGDHPDNAQQSRSDVQSTHDFDGSHISHEYPDHNPFSPCTKVTSAAPESIDTTAAPLIKNSSLNWFVVDAAISLAPLAANRTEYIAPYEIPPPVSLYLRELRLLL